MNSRGLYITFTGLDGAGKSTQAGNIAQYLRSLGHQCYLCEPKDDLIPQLAIGLASRYARTPREHFGTFAFELAKAFSIVRHQFSLVEPNLQFKVNVIEPRSIFCRLGLAIANKCPDHELLREVYALCPKSDITFFLDVRPEEAFRRVNKRGTDFEALEDLKKFYAGLQSITKEQCVRIDGMQPPERVFLAIKTIIDEELVTRLDGRFRGSRRMLSLNTN